MAYAFSSSSMLHHDLNGKKNWEKLKQGKQGTEGTAAVSIPAAKKNWEKNVNLKQGTEGTAPLIERRDEINNIAITHPPPWPGPWPEPSTGDFPKRYQKKDPPTPTPEPEKDDDEKGKEKKYPPKDLPMCAIL